MKSARASAGAANEATWPSPAGANATRATGAESAGGDPAERTRTAETTRTGIDWPSATASTPTVAAVSGRRNTRSWVCRIATARGPSARGGASGRTVGGICSGTRRSAFSRSGREKGGCCAYASRARRASSSR